MSSCWGDHFRANSNISGFIRVWTNYVEANAFGNARRVSFGCSFLRQLLFSAVRAWNKLRFDSRISGDAEVRVGTGARYRLPVPSQRGRQLARFPVGSGLRSRNETTQQHGHRHA